MSTPLSDSCCRACGRQDNITLMESATTDGKTELHHFCDADCLGEYWQETPTAAQLERAALLYATHKEA